MDIQRNVMQYVETAHQLRLGELIDKLESIPKSETVRFDFEYAYPTHLESYRGFYDELALGFSFDGDDPTVEQILAECKKAIGKTFHGYKGGEYTMNRATPVWVANSGNAGSTGIIDIEKVDVGVVIKTAYMDA